MRSAAVTGSLTLLLIADMTFRGPSRRSPLRGLIRLELAINARKNTFSAPQPSRGPLTLHVTDYARKARYASRLCQRPIQLASFKRECCLAVSMRQGDTSTTAWPGLYKFISMIARL